MKSALILLTFLFGLSSICPSFAYDTTNKNQGKVVTSPKVDTSIPSWFAPSTNKDIAHWLKVLPYEEYRYHNQYIVIPAMGMVAPLMELETGSQAYKDFIKTKGKSFDSKAYNRLLVGGPTIYPGTAPIGTKGNTFIFGHSNYRVNEPGSFKTIFRLTYNIELGDKIWVYKKFDGKRVFFEYTVDISKLIGAHETKYMLPEKDKITISLSACRPIGTAKQRWLNRGELTYVEELDKVLNPPKPKPPVKPKRKTKTVVVSGSIASGTQVIRS
ncbi:MAG TPA: sortase [Candidatus Absconditabacterales bacterium]|nr:sortase [Candidatus Absconditabacterales bacterium]HNG97477.1 sortase [Candidatus Absconditabacterales bacterium]